MKVVIVLTTEETKTPLERIELNKDFWKRMEKKLRMKPREVFDELGLDLWILPIVKKARYINEKDLRRIFWFCYLKALEKLEIEQEIFKEGGYGIYYITPYERQFECC